MDFFFTLHKVSCINGGEEHKRKEQMFSVVELHITEGWAVGLGGGLRSWRGFVVLSWDWDMIRFFLEWNGTAVKIHSTITLFMTLMRKLPVYFK